MQFIEQRRAVHGAQLRQRHRRHVIHGKSQIGAHGLYVLPYALEVGASLFGQQGYPYRCTAR